MADLQQTIVRDQKSRLRLGAPSGEDVEIELTLMAGAEGFTGEDSEPGERIEGYESGVGGSSETGEEDERGMERRQA